MIPKYADPRLPLWLRVTFYAASYAHNGLCHLGPGELRQAIDPWGTIGPSEVSRAIRTAKVKGLLEMSSTGRCLVPARTCMHTPDMYIPRTRC